MNILSVIMPAYNEEKSIAKSIQEVQTNVLNKIRDSELIIINDGSIDKTGLIVEETARLDARIRIINQQNSGHGKALMRGMDISDAIYLFLIDADGQIPLNGFYEAWKELKCDATFGIRTKRQDSPIRLVITLFLRLLILICFGVWIYDANIPYKLIRRHLWLDARKKIPEDSLFPSILLAIYIVKSGFRVKTRPVEHLERTSGISMFEGWKILRYCKSAIKELLTFRKSL